MARAFIRSATIDWTDVAANSYAHSIPALARLGELDFDRPVTFLPGRTAAASQRCSRP